MGDMRDPRFEGIDFERSYLLGVIYDDESLTLEMDFKLTEQHPSFVAPQPDGEGCYREGFVRFADIEDLEIDKAQPTQDGSADYSTVYSGSAEAGRFAFSTGWGEIKLTAKSVRVALD